MSTIVAGTTARSDVPVGRDGRPGADGGRAPEVGAGGGRGVGPRVRQGVTLAVAAGVAAGVCALLRRAHPDVLTGRTDVVGHPTFADFDVRVYFVNYGLVAVVFPVVALAVYAGITALASGRREPLLPATTAASPPADPDPARYRAPAALARAGVVGLVLGMAVAITVDAAAGDVAAVVLGVAAAYVVVVALLAAAVSRLGGAGAVPTAAGLNALVAPATLLALVVASDATTVTVADTGEVVAYAWFPLLAGVVGVVAGVVVVAVALQRVGAARWPAVERWAVLLLPVPVAVWLLSAGLRMTVGGMDAFHEGEVLAATRRIAEGQFPWRDVLFIHGLMGDVVPGLLGRALFGDSRWAALAVGGPVLIPLFWVGNYFLCLYLFRRNWLLLAASQVLALLGSLPFVHFRMVLLPWLLLALAALLGRATWPRAAAVAGVAVAQFVLAPEASYFSLSAGLVVVLFDVVHRRPGDRLVDAFGRTLRTGAVATVAGVGFLGYLASNSALDPFFDYYRTFVSGHELSGGLPIEGSGRFFTFWMAAPVALVLAAWWYGAARVGSRRWLTVPDWVMAAAVLGLLPYYVKFLSRAEVGHLGQVAATAMVPLLYAGYRVVEEVEAPLRRWRSWALPVSGAVLVAAVAWSPISAGALLRSLPDRWRDDVDHDSALARVGYEDADGVAGPTGTAGIVDPRVVGDLDTVLDAYVGDDGRVFDFTNSPALFGYLLDHRTATRYFHVSLAKPAAVQRDLIAELEQERPALVVFDSIDFGMPGWDHVPNTVRHYLVSDYLLDHYVPALGLHGFTFLRRADVPEVPVAQLAPRLSEAPLTDDLYLGPRVCDWGYAPNFLSLRPDAAAPRVDVPLRSTGPVVSTSGWAADGRTRTPVAEVLAVVDGKVVDRFPAGGQRPDVATLLDSPAALAAGFSGSFPLPAGGRTPAGAVRFYGRTADGVAGELPGPSGARPLERRGVLQDESGAALRVVPGAVVGYVDQVQELGVTYQLDLPADARDHDWLEVTTAGPLVDDHLTIDDPTGAASHSISFGTLPDRSGGAPGAGGTLAVRVGSCSQWKGYDPDEPLLLRSAEGVEVTAVRLADSVRGG